MRAVVLAITLLFIAMLATLTAPAIVPFGVSARDVVAILILFSTGFLGSLRHPPP